MTDSLAVALRQTGNHRPPTCASGTHNVRRATRGRRLRQLELRREHGLDRTLAETFPCSDPLSSIPDPQLDR
jgi:hypothetical protein